MSDDLTAVVEAVYGVAPLVRGVVSQVKSDQERGAKLAEAMRGLWPACGLAACLMARDHAAYGSVLDATGAARAEWRDSMIGILHSADQEAPTHLPDAIALPHHGLALQWVAGQDRRIGLMALAYPDALSEQGRAMLHFFLAGCAAQLGLHLMAEEKDLAWRQRGEEVGDLTWLANVGELTGPIIHEFNNFLNVCLLNITLLERQLGQSSRPDLSDIRRQATQAASLVRRLQQFRQKDRPAPRPVDLNQVIVDLLPGFRRGSPVPVTVNSGQARVRFDPAAELPAVMGSVSDLKRLVHFLIAHSAAAAGGDVDVHIQTGASAEMVWLRLEDSGPAVAPEALDQLFDSQGPHRRGVDQLELAACKSLLRRMRGEIRAENLAGSGVAMVVELPIRAPLGY